MARQISSAIRLVNSVDNYIDTHRQDARVAMLAKAAIIYSILKAERASTLFFGTAPAIRLSGS